MFYCDPMKVPTKLEQNPDIFHFFQIFWDFSILGQTNLAMGVTFIVNENASFGLGFMANTTEQGDVHFPGHQGCHMSFQNRILVLYICYLLPFLPVCCSFRQLYMFESFSCLCCPDYNAAECSLTRSHHTCIVALSRHTYISKRLKCNNIWHGKDWPMWIQQS